MTAFRAYGSKRNCVAVNAFATSVTKRYLTESKRFANTRGSWTLLFTFVRAHTLSLPTKKKTPTNKETNKNNNRCRKIIAAIWFEHQGNTRYPHIQKQSNRYFRLQFEQWYFFIFVWRLMFLLNHPEKALKHLFLQARWHFCCTWLHYEKL